MLARLLTRIVSLIPVAFICSCSMTSDTYPVFGEDRTFSDHREVDVRYRSDDGIILDGTLFLPLHEGPHPSVLLQFGSGPWTRPEYDERTGVPGWIHHGYAVLGYDKRGVGDSGGTCCDWRDPAYYHSLASDVRAGVDAMRAREDINPDRIGLFGASEGGWVVPIAAAEGDLDFTIIFSGPAVTLREELLFSYYTGDDQGCEPTGLTEDEIWSGLEAGTLEQDIFPFLDGDGFDPVPFLESMDNRGLWLFGGNDTSIPVQRSTTTLETIRHSRGRDWTIVVEPRANHALIVDGAMCQTDGRVMDLSFTFDWLDGTYVADQVPRVRNQRQIHQTNRSIPP